MTKLLEQAVSQARKLPDEAQDNVAEALFAYIAAQDQHYRLAPEQIADVKRIQQRLRNGETRLATDDEVAAVWKKSGL
jgi:hypothetical protein